MHEALNAFVVDFVAEPNQLVVYSADAVSVFMLVEYCYYGLFQFFIADGDKILSIYLIIISRSGHLHSLQQILQFVACLSEPFDDFCFFALSCAAHFSCLKAISFFITAFSAL